MTQRWFLSDFIAGSPSVAPLFRASERTAREASEGGPRPLRLEDRRHADGGLLGEGVHALAADKMGSTLLGPLQK